MTLILDDCGANKRRPPGPKRPPNRSRHARAIKLQSRALGPSSNGNGRRAIQTTTGTNPSIINNNNEAPGAIQLVDEQLAEWTLEAAAQLRVVCSSWRGTSEPNSSSHRPRRAPPPDPPGAPPRSGGATVAPGNQVAGEAPLSRRKWALLEGPARLICMQRGAPGRRGGAICISGPSGRHGPNMNSGRPRARARLTASCSPLSAREMRQLCGARLAPARRRRRRRRR